MVILGKYYEAWLIFILNLPHNIGGNVYIVTMYGR